MIGTVQYKHPDPSEGLGCTKLDSHATLGNVETLPPLACMLAGVIVGMAKVSQINETESHCSRDLSGAGQSAAS